jgi:hypothetical protein
MIKSQFNRYVRDALSKRQRKSNIDEANAVIDVFVGKRNIVRDK